jgi:hypothetical protein
MADQTDRFADYVDVAERIRIFRDRHPEGSLQPLDPAEPFQIVNIDGQIFVQYTAVAYRHPQDTLPGIAVSWEPFPGRTPYTAGSELMNAETAAWGRAIVAALAADTKKIASLDEVRARRAAQEQAHPSSQSAPPATIQQEKALYAISKKLDRLPPAKGSLSKQEAGRMIEKLQAELDAKTAPAPETEEEPF